MSSRGHSSKAVDSWEALKAVKILQTAKKAGIVFGTNPVCVAAPAFEGEMLT